VSGLAYANSIAFTVGMLFLAYLARRAPGGIGIRSIILTLGKSMLGSLPMAVLLVAFLSWKPDSGCTEGCCARRRSGRGVLASVGLTIGMYLLPACPSLRPDLARRKK